MILLVVLFASPLFSTTTPHLITSLPGWTGKIPVVMTSGYITTNVTFQRNLFYIFVQNPDPSAPVILWLQGGPGCSGMMSFATEHGPFRLQEDQSLKLNPYPLTSLANVIYVDSPAGIGYSYDTDFDDVISGGDTRTTNDLYAFLQTFYQLYPAFKTNDFYTFGESYAGVYCPLIAQKIAHENSKLPAANRINLQGMFISNGIMDFRNYENSRVYYMAYHGMASMTQLKHGMEACHGDFWKYGDLPSCQNWTKIFADQIVGVNILDTYGDCYGGIKDVGRGRVRRELGLSALISPVNDKTVNCIDTITSFTYFNAKDTKEALGVASEFEKFVGNWTMCSPLIEYEHNYKTEYNSTVDVIARLKASGKYRLMFASGDVDLCVPTLCNEMTLSEKSEEGNVLLPESDEFPQWFTNVPNKQVAGWFQKDETLTFATVRGAGHMISEYRPMESYTLYRRWLQGTFPVD